MKAFLIGERNLNFFTPDSIFEVAEITPDSIDKFLSSKELGDRWQLLGFLSKEESVSLPGYIEVMTSGSVNPADWKAKLQLTEEGNSPNTVEIKTPER